jgi:lipoprotein-anchoring transpeptidase ErfK/SrfK
VAKEYGLVVRHVPAGGSVDLGGGDRLEFRFGVAGVTGPDGRFAPLPLDEQIVFDGVLYVPPLGTMNRRIEGQLGRYRLDLGDGFLLHGTPYKRSIGEAATHGCIRLRDEDIEWLYEFIPVGTRVYIY